MGTAHAEYGDATDELLQYFGVSKDAEMGVSSDILAKHLEGSAEEKESEIFRPKDEPGGSVPPKTPHEKGSGHRSRKFLWHVVIVFLLLFGLGGWALQYKSQSQNRELEAAQTQLQQALSDSSSLRDQELKNLTDKISTIRRELDGNPPADLQSQYNEIINKLSTLASSTSTDEKLAQTAQQLVTQLTSQAGEGISLSGPNNTTIKNSGVLSLNNKTGNVGLESTTDQTTLSVNGNSIKIGTAQDIAQASSPTFQNQTLTGNSTIQGSQAIGGDLSVAGTATRGGYTLCDSSNNCGYSGAGSSFVQGGNNFGNPANIGTNDNYALNLRTNGITRLSVDTAGNTGLTGNLTTPGSISANTLSGNGAGVTNVNASSLNGNTAGNSSGQIALNNGTLNNNLNADMLDGQQGSYYQDASNLNAGTISDARLSANVALQNAANVYTLQQSFSGGFLATAGTLSGNLTVNGATVLQGLTATGILQNGYQVCDASNNCSYAAASGGLGIFKTRQ